MYINLDQKDGMLVELTEIIEEIKKSCSDPTGHLYKDHFRIALVFMVLDLYNKNKFESDTFIKMNKILREILGPGHTIQTCMQFFQGKRGLAIAKKYLSSVTAEENASSILEEISSNSTIH